MTLNQDMALDGHARSRRQFLAILAALGASAMLPHGAAPATASSKARRVDVHHHFFPPEYLEPLAAWNKQEGIAAGLQKPQQDWSIAAALEEMDRGGVATGVLSISTPGVWFGEKGQARRLARICNDYGAQMGRDHPGRFGLFAAMPMPDIDGVLHEIEYALDVLKADGIGFMTSYGDVWPGDPRFAPIFEELDRRKAVAYFHPLSPTCCGHLLPGVPASLIEYPHDTARAVLSLLMSGAFARYKNIRFLFSHAGASIPVLAGRIINGSKGRKDLAEIAPDGIEHELKKLYYDTANSAYPPTMAALLKFVPVSQVLFGSDFPYLTITQNVEGFAKLGLTGRELRAIDRGNAERLLPRFKA
ncbi:MAG TPA: amidohydrolase family protein [Alphaproteobacteria bacterium]|nr:amidohydrolase family protein [Alphaproteobacteria bacterium]